MAGKLLSGDKRAQKERGFRPDVQGLQLIGVHRLSNHQSTKKDWINLLSPRIVLSSVGQDDRIIRHYSYVPMEDS